MSTLHILKSSHPEDAKALVDLCNSDDCIVIMQNGCLLQQQIKHLEPDANVFVIEQHCLNRGISLQFEAIDIKQVAALSAQHENSTTW